MDSLHISFAHHLSLSYYSGGEKWLINTANELVKRGHDVEIYALPFLLDGKPKINPKTLLNDIPYTEGKHHKVKADVTYITYNPLSWLNFQTSPPRIAGLHSETYWQSPHIRYGLLPNISNIVNRFTSYFELRRFQAVHAVSNVYPINHPKVFHIPNFVDSSKFKPCREKNNNFTVVYPSRKVWQKGWDIFSLIEKRAKTNVLVSGMIPESELPSFYSQAHVTVVPARVDTFGLSIVESMMCETPVITSPLPVHKSLNLPLLYAKTVEDYLDGIERFRSVWCENRDGFNIFAQMCRQMSLRFDKNLIMTKLNNMFEEVVNANT